MRQLPPSSSEIEVSVFGRGYGEAVLVHFGDGRWALIDSLVNSDARSAPAKYLQEIGVASTAVKLLLATHWHDDHVAGISEFYRSASQALLVIPFAMDYPQVQAYLGSVQSGGAQRISSGVEELRRLAQIHDEQGRHVRLAKANTVLLRYRRDQSSHGEAISVEAISPCDEDANAFLRQIASAPAAQAGKRVMPFSSNEVSVAVWLSIGDHHILLGADLENGPEANRGWKSVLSSPASVHGRAAILKVPSNAHHQLLWDTLLTPQPIAALTTWNRSSKLPKPADVDRILNVTPHAYVTSGIDSRPKSRPRAVERTLQEAAIKLRSVARVAGQIRLRLDLASKEQAWRVELFNGARRLADLAA